MNRHTTSLRPGDVLVTPEGEFQVLTFPSSEPDEKGRVSWKAWPVGSDVVETQEAQADWVWEVRRAEWG